jgi:hypothetical protein
MRSSHLSGAEPESKSKSNSNGKTMRRAWIRPSLFLAADFKRIVSAHLAQLAAAVKQGRDRAEPFLERIREFF